MDHGDEREMESGLIFNQLICEFESRRPCQILNAPVAQLEEHDASNVVVAGSSPARSSILPRINADWSDS